MSIDQAKSVTETFAPIAIFCYRRPEHLAALIVSLRRCPEFPHSPVYVFADGPRGDADVAAVNATRKMARELLGDRANYIESGENLGLADSLVRGVSDVCLRHGRVIVLEDDLTLSSSYLYFMNAALEKYKEVHEVMQIAGWIPSVPQLANTDQAVFVPFTSSWGWATWARAWSAYDPMAFGWSDLLKDREMRKRFDLGGKYPFSRMLRKQMTQEGNSWAIRWYYSVFSRGGLTLVPPRSMVHNGGMDGSGEHFQFVSSYQDDELVDTGNLVLPDLVAVTEHMPHIARRMQEMIWKIRVGRLKSKIVSTIPRSSA